MTEGQNTPNPLWTADSTHPEVAGALRESLRQVVDPEIGLNIIELGLIREAIIEDASVEVTMIMTTPFCPYAPALLEATRNKAQEGTNLEARVELGAELWDPSMMEEGAGAAWGLY